MNIRHHPCYPLEDERSCPWSQGQREAEEQHMQRPRSVKQHDDFDGFIWMSCTMPERDWVKVRLDIVTGWDQEELLMTSQGLWTSSWM